MCIVCLSSFCYSFCTAIVYGSYVHYTPLCTSYIYMYKHSLCGVTRSMNMFIRLFKIFYQFYVLKLTLLFFQKLYFHSTTCVYVCENLSVVHALPLILLEKCMLLTIKFSSFEIVTFMINMHMCMC